MSSRDLLDSAACSLPVTFGSSLRASAHADAGDPSAGWSEATPAACDQPRGEGTPVETPVSWG